MTHTTAYEFGLNNFITTINKYWCTWRPPPTREHLEMIWNDKLRRIPDERLADALKQERMRDYNARQPNWNRVFDDVFEKAEREEKNEFDLFLFCIRRDMEITCRNKQTRAAIENYSNADVWHAQMRFIALVITHFPVRSKDPVTGLFVSAWHPREDAEPCTWCGNLKKMVEEKKLIEEKEWGYPFSDEFLDNDNPCGLGKIACDAHRTVAFEHSRWIEFHEQSEIDVPDYLQEPPLGGHVEVQQEIPF